MPSTTPYEEILSGLVHDLRQPLGNIETGIFYLDLVLDHPSDRLREQLRAMERQVAQAAGLLHCAAEELRARRAQSVPDRGRASSAAAAESFDFTKSVTAEVT
jgi:signal transduction histidine kinase